VTIKIRFTGRKHTLNKETVFSLSDGWQVRVPNHMIAGHLVTLRRTDLLVIESKTTGERQSVNWVQLSNRFDSVIAQKEAA